MALRDRFGQCGVSSTEAAPEAYVLFVGGGFYANMAGIVWYARNVAPTVPVKTLVVGMGLDSIKAELQRCSGIEVVGAVDDLSPWYLGARFVVAPIFDGSGMKTKVAEALMYGKRIVGTVEAFTGYEDVIERVGAACRSHSEFAEAVKAEMCREHVAVDPDLRRIYEQRYSFSAARDRLRQILCEAEPPCILGVH